MHILRAAATHGSAVAVRHPVAGSCSYGQLLAASEALTAQLSRSLPAVKGLDGPRIGVYAEPGAPYVAGTWSCWMSGGIAVPLAVSHPPHELEYVLRDAGITAVISPPSAHDKLKDVCHAIGAKLHTVPDELLLQQADNSSSSSSGAGLHSSSSGSRDDSGALIVYTSGTTGRPKGALHTHRSLAAQVECLVSAWHWQATDTIVHALPLHHVHGIINALYCAQYVGATVNFLQKFSPAAVWQQLLAEDVSVLMAVPTMYSYLLSYYDQHMSAQEQAAAREAAGRLRLTVSGSAAAPVPLLQRWEQLSGQRLLERYGMTETGMILSNPYEGERRPGFVGLPLPGVQVKVVQPSNSSSSSGNGKPAGQLERHTDSSSGPAAGPVQGELAVRGPMLFREYWGRPDATAAAFDDQGYFLTGDTVSFEGSPPYYKIQGRTSVDIIKSGGYKLSALDIESTLLHHPRVAEAAVLGVPDQHLGQVVAALVYPKAGADEAGDDLLQQLKQLCRKELPGYSCPRQWTLLDAPLPRNAMGKVNKKELLAQFFPA